MGYKISFVLGTLLAVVCVGSWMYIKSLNEQIGVLKGNQVVLESKITEQNSLKVFEKVLGPEHPFVASTYNK